MVPLRKVLEFVHVISTRVFFSLQNFKMTNLSKYKTSENGEMVDFKRRNVKIIDEM